MAASSVAAGRRRVVPGSWSLSRSARPTVWRNAPAVWSLQCQLPAPGVAQHAGAPGRRTSPGRQRAALASAIALSSRAGPNCAASRGRPTRHAGGDRAVARRLRALEWRCAACVVEIGVARQAQRFAQLFEVLFVGERRRLVEPLGHHQLGAGASERRPSTSSSTRTKACGHWVTVAAPKRNGSRSVTGRSNSATDRRRNDKAFMRGCSRLHAR